MKESFLIDANSFMTPHLTFYPFDFAQSFWKQMELHIKSGSIVVLDMVKNEILQGNDSLKKWIEKLPIGVYISHKEQRIIEKYSEIIEYIRTQPCYKPEALKEWSEISVADPWLIATAAVNGYTIITFENSNNGLNEYNPSKKAKIPDVAKAFNVKTNNLYYMMRYLNFKL
ncbi:MAG: DUF4411 family protein [Acutalibacteraceae bacterium]